jgi:hypothetical protein
VNRLFDTVRESNRQGRDGWERFGPHRARVQALLSRHANESSSLGILGAGNLNDVVVVDLLKGFAQIDLVDLDPVTVLRSLRRHGVDARERCVVHGPIDLTGVLDELALASPAGSPGADDLLASIQGAPCGVPGGPFDVTASTCVLTQLLQSVVDSALPRGDVPRVALALRDKHLRDLVALTRPGGELILITDVVSTTSAPRLLHTPEARLGREMATLVEGFNFFTGTNPYRILALLEEDPRFRREVTGARLVDPWLWAVTPDRQHLTYAIVAKRARRAEE